MLEYHVQYMHTFTADDLEPWNRSIILCIEEKVCEWLNEMQFYKLSKFYSLNLREKLVEKQKNLQSLFFIRKGDIVKVLYCPNMVLQRKYFIAFCIVLQLDNIFWACKRFLCVCVLLCRGKVYSYVIIYV